MISKIKWILFDFGGCLDSDGLHSRRLFFNQFANSNLIDPIGDETYFQEAYTYCDRKIIDENLVINSPLLRMNEIMCSLIADKIHLKNDNKILKVAKKITETQSYYLIRNRPILERLSKEFDLGIVSNFSGNLKIILDEYSLTKNFNFVLDSYHVGHEKPDPEIFKIALMNCQTSPEEVCFVGDNPDRDITPAKLLGMKTVLINPNQISGNADYTFSSIEEIFSASFNSLKNF